ncbi:GNAT family N-acetyltransferase [Thermodesulfobacteriota bacterium]
MNLLNGFFHILQKIHKYGFVKALSIFFQNYIYRVFWVGLHCALGPEMVKPDDDCPYEIQFWGSDKYRATLGTSKYLSIEDLDEFDRCRSTCLVAIDRGIIIASSWMVQGDHYLSEFKHTVKISDKEFFSCRSYVLPAYRGKHLLSHIIYAFSNNIDQPCHKIWCFIHNWNIASIKTYEKIGFKHKKDVGFITFLGFKFVLHRKFNRNRM